VKQDDEKFEQEPDEHLDDSRQEQHSGPGDSENPQEDFCSEIENRQPKSLDEKEVKVMGVYEHHEQGMQPNAFVLLRDNRGRQVLIYIGHYEAFAISLALEGKTPDRPMTHDLTKNLMERLGGKIERIVIDDLWQETYYAKISVATNGEVLDIDSRPSDAIALALRSDAPIYMAESVLDQADVNEEL